MKIKTAAEADSRQSRRMRLWCLLLLLLSRGSRAVKVALHPVSRQCISDKFSELLQVRKCLDRGLVYIFGAVTCLGTGGRSDKI